MVILPKSWLIVYICGVGRLDAIILNLGYASSSTLTWSLLHTETH